MKKQKEVVNSEVKEDDSKANVKATVMYVGPTIVGEIKQYSVYKNGLPKNVSKLAEQVPAIKHLLVQTGHITEARKQINEKGSVLNVMYNKVLDYIKGGK